MMKVLRGWCYETEPKEWWYVWKIVNCPDVWKSFAEHAEDFDVNAGKWKSLVYLSVCACNKGALFLDQDLVELKSLIRL